MNENLKRLELILKQDISEGIFIIESEGVIIDCSDFTGSIDLDKIILDNFDDGEFLTNVTFVLGDNIELIAEYQHINVIFGSGCQIYVDMEDSSENKIKITGKNNNKVNVGKNFILGMNNNNEITCGDDCKITVRDNNLIEVIEDFDKIFLEGAVEIVGEKDNRIILPLANSNSNSNSIIVGEDSNIFIKGYDISFI